MSDSEPAPATAPALGYDEFTDQAERIGVPADLWPELYPMVRDLRALADQINALTPELHAEIPTAALSAGSGD